MPFENLAKIMWQVRTTHQDAGENFQNSAMCVYYNMRDVEQWGKDKFLEAHKNLAEVLYWLKINDPNYYTQIIQSIFQDIPDEFYPLVFDEMYSCQIRDLDIKKLSMITIQHIVDDNNVGSGNVLIDIVIRNWDFAQQIEDHEIIESVVNLIPEIIAKLDGIRRLNPYKLESRYEDNKDMYISPFYPKTPICITDSNNIHKQAKHAISNLIHNDKFATEIFTLMLANKDEKNKSFWDLLIENNYSQAEQVKFGAIMRAEHDFIEQIEMHRKTNPDDPLCHLRFSLNLARNIYLQNGVVAHMDCAIEMCLSKMSSGHNYLLGDQRLTGNPNLRELVRTMLLMPNTSDENRNFTEFLDQIKIAGQSRPSPALRF